MSRKKPQNTATETKGILGKNFKLLFVTGFWVLIMLLAISSQLVHTSSCRNILDVIRLFEIPNYGTWAVLSPIILLIGSKFPLDKKQWRSRIFVLIGFGLLLSFIQAIPQELVNVSIDTSESHEKSISHSVTNHIIPQLPLKFLLYCAVLGMGYAFDYYRRVQERDAKLGQMEKQLVQAKLDVLKSQLHPHFLFNTLNAISALVEKDPAASRRMIARLSELLRLTLDSKDKHEITLDHEISLLKHYLEIEKIRFQDRLKIEYNVSPEVSKALVPNMILQPLVENAIRHGIQQRRSGGSIKITAERDNGLLRIAVQDDGPGLNGNGHSVKNGVGLKNTQSRLAQLYGDGHKFDLENLDNHGLKVSISLPFHKKPLAQ